MNRLRNEQKNGGKTRHEKIKTFLRVVGGIAIAAGLAFTIVGGVDFFRTMSEFRQPKLFWCFFAGLPLIFIGVSMLSFGFHREVGRYIKNETVPIFNEAGKEIAPAIAEIAKAAKEGSSEACGTRCACGTVNEPDAKFCKKCGKPLIKLCPYCGAEVDCDSVFCAKCGKRID